MKKIFWGALVLSGVVVLGASVIAQETPTQPAMPQMQGMGPIMGMGMMGQGGQSTQMGQMGSIMPMMQMMDACAQMMGTTSSSSQEPKK